MSPRIRELLAGALALAGTLLVLGLLLRWASVTINRREPLPQLRHVRHGYANANWSR